MDEAKAVGNITGNQVKKFVMDNLFCSLAALPGEIYQTMESNSADNHSKIGVRNWHPPIALASKKDGEAAIQKKQKARNRMEKVLQSQESAGNKLKIGGMSTAAMKKYRPRHGDRGGTFVISKNVIYMKCKGFARHLDAPRAIFVFV
ncbi:hypothetical protein Tco_0497519 [Tanacetum coccineum]